MGYIIWDKEKKKYISFGADSKYAVVDNIENAYIWKTANKANNVILSMSKREKMKRYHLKLELKEVAKSISSIYDIERCQDVDLGLEDIVDKIKELSRFTSDIEMKRAYLSQELQNCDLKITDIEHAAEFYTLNASQGYKLYKMLHDTRCERRRYKDELSIIDSALKAKFSSAEMKKIEKQIDGLSNRKYLPRVINELFGV